jgi:hypothetical protein
LRKARPFPCELIDARRGRLRASIATEVAQSHVVSQDEDDVWLRARLRSTGLLECWPDQKEREAVEQNTEPTM